jgi:hypothetical protein
MGPTFSDATQTSAIVDRRESEADADVTVRRKDGSGLLSARVQDGEPAAERPDIGNAGRRGPRRQSSDLRRRAWEWALANRGPYGQLPSGRMIADAFEMSP